MQQKATN